MPPPATSYQITGQFNQTRRLSKLVIFDGPSSDQDLSDLVDYNKALQGSL